MQSAYFITQQAWLGRDSVGVPGTVAGLFHAHSKYGSGKVGLRCCSWPRLVQMVIDHAFQNGLERSKSLTDAIETKITQQQLQQLDAANLNTFVEGLKAGGGGGDKISPHSPHSTTYLKMIETLNMLADHGKDAFYKLAIADQIVSATGTRLPFGNLPCMW